MEILEGGRPDVIKRIGDTVQRPAGPWTPATQALLQHLHQQGFHGAPTPHGITNDGNELVSFIPGHVSNYPLSAAAKSTTALTSAATLLRDFHRASATFLTAKTQAYTWQLPARPNADVICHGDFAPYNVVLNGETAIAIIDFDTAHPAPRLWDIAYALYRWAPFTRPDNTDGFGSTAQQIQRATLFCDHYGLDAKERSALPLLIVERLYVMVDTIVNGAAQGNTAFQANLADGHHLLYIADAEYVKAQAKIIATGLQQ